MARRAIAALLLVAFAVFWFGFTGRIVSAFVLLLVAPLVFLRRSRLRPSLAISLFAVGLSLAWSPVGLTFYNAPGPPRLVECCCCAPYVGNLPEVRARSLAGQCMLCSDLVFGWEPRWYLFW